MKRTLIHDDAAVQLPKHTECYTDDWKRTEPDIVVYLPKERCAPDGYGDHFLVSPTPGGDLLATWTMSSYEGSLDTRIVYARSEDNGITWTLPQLLVGREGKEGVAAMFGFPVISKTGRIYFYYNKDKGIYDSSFRTTAVLSCHISDDDGRTWKDSDYEFDYARTKYDHPDPNVPCNAIVWQAPIRDVKGRPLAIFTRFGSLERFPHSAPDRLGYRYIDRQGQLMRFENIDQDPDPADVKITWLPTKEGVLRYPVNPAQEPEYSRGYSSFHEPAAALLPDGRLFMTASSTSGFLLYSVSEDPDGRKWRKPEMLRYMDQGAPLLHPLAPAAFYRLENERYLIFYHGHDGSKYQGAGPRDNRGRRPTCISVGEYRPDAYQPIWFSQAKEIYDTHGIGAGPEKLVWLTQYSSLTEHNGRRIYWYADRKHFMLGRYISDEMLADMRVPT